MSDEFTLSIFYNGEHEDYHTSLLLQGYSYKICVTIDEMKVYFEPDEEGSYRVIKMPGQDENQLEKVNKVLLQELREKIEEEPG
jgi:hypothetical protein